MPTGGGLHQQCMALLNTRSCTFEKGDGRTVAKSPVRINPGLFIKGFNNLARHKHRYEVFRDFVRVGALSVFNTFVARTMRSWRRNICGSEPATQQRKQRGLPSCRASWWLARCRAEGHPGPAPHEPGAGQHPQRPILRPTGNIGAHGAPHLWCWCRARR